VCADAQKPGFSTTAWIRDRFRQTAKRAALPAPEPMPARVGRWKVIERIGRGSIANVYRAADDGGREVAVKVIRPDQAGAEAEAVFQREGSILQGLKHPDIIALHETGRAEQGVYLVMDYIAGPTMQYVIEEGAPREELVAMLSRVARAVHHAHKHGIVHRDLKPQNILVGADGPIVTDFGIARAMDAVTRVKGAAPVGTPTHMAPEQIDRRLANVGPATDVWALGVILYYVLAKRLPFYDIDSPGIFARVLKDAPRAPRLVDSAVPAALEAVCLRALEKDPEDRHPSAEAFADELDRAAAGKKVKRPWRFVRRLLRRLFKR